MRVLLIEDDSATAQSLELMLRSESFNVYTTDLGEEGIDLGKVYDHDIILLDLNLPDMSGFDVLVHKDELVARIHAIVRRSKGTRAVSHQHGRSVRQSRYQDGRDQRRTRAFDR
jgi:DNA-binding response OmpR family regulator